MKYEFELKYVVLVLFLMVCLATSFFIFQSITAPTYEIVKQEHIVKLANEQKNFEMKKIAPNFYNGTERKVAYLTFDDGPGKHTAELLKILKETEIKATFFLVGTNIKLYPELVKQEYLDGHYIAMHSISHNFKKLYTNGDYVSEMEKCQRLIKNIIGRTSTLTRPPYGSKPGLNEELRNQVLASGFKVWDWTIDSFDWKYNKISITTAVEQIAKNVISNATKNREVILMHDIHPQSVAAVPVIIKGLQEKGYEFEVYREENHFPLNFWHDNRI
ncbi:peptidoglycan-N-acetylglucosamine deacetylase [Bacillus cereus]|uniref:peptidoglycan-N-acetylglucosamine deacetylase n=1 Tax=Bacillus cereus group TaxID=86661 RepID=UPI000279DF48|nr:polysaccharide deacetylase family protein [Bacillus cereus]EJR80226.1 hypothetical protein IKA_05658 [Bacillus cereus VD169]